MNILTIRTGQNGYSPEQVADRAMTVGELIERLQEAVEIGEVAAEAKVVVGGYGRGAVWEPARSVEVPELEDDEYED